MKPLQSIRHQLEALREEAVRLSASEFPYEHGREAVERIVAMCSHNLWMLSHLPDDVAGDEATLQIVAEAARYATDAVPCLGFILRSTNVRNAFEVHGPLLRLSRKLLADKNLKLILSSEWFASPVNLLSPQVLSNDYILIGQPATESSNPFVIPLAGHELGHSVWAIKGLGKEFKSLIQGGSD